MQVNYPIKLKHSADRLYLDRLLARLCKGDLELEALDGPLGGLALPLWTSVVFSAQHTDYAALKRTVNCRLAEAGVADRFEDRP